MDISAKCEYLECFVPQEAMDLLIAFAGFSDEVLDFIAREYRISLP